MELILRGKNYTYQFLGVCAQVKQQLLGCIATEMHVTSSHAIEITAIGKNVFYFPVFSELFAHDN